MTSLVEIINELPNRYCRLYRDRSYYLQSIQGEKAWERVDFLNAWVNDLGSLLLSRVEFQKSLTLFPSNIAAEIEANSVIGEEYVSLRGFSYYAGGGLTSILEEFGIKYGPEEVRRMVIGKFSRNHGLLMQLRESPHLGRIEAMVPVISLLDHQRAYALMALKGLMTKMFNGVEFPSPLFYDAMDLARETISNLYGFCLTGELLRSNDFSAVFKRILYEFEMSPKDWERELDDFLKIILYGIMVIAQSDSPFQIVVNPFSGAIEVGLALEAMGKVLGKDLVEDIIFLRHSMYDKRNRRKLNLSLEGAALISEFFDVTTPTQLRGEYHKKLFGKEAVIIDDNVTTLETMEGLREGLIRTGICPKVILGAIEYGRIDRLGRADQTLLSKLHFEPVGDRMSLREQIPLILSSLRKNCNKFINENYH